MDFYLILDLVMIAGPLALSFDRKVAYWRSWGRVFPALGVVVAVFGGWDVWMSLNGVWAFNPVYTGTIRWGGMPPGEWLFFVCVPFACIFILACARAYFPERSLKVRRWPWLAASLVLLILSLVVLLTGSQRIYTWSVLLVCALVLGLAAWLVPATLASRNFWIGMAITYVPFLIFNTILTALPVVTYDNVRNLALRVGTIPVEDFVYSFAMLLLGLTAHDAFARIIPLAPERLRSGGKA